MPDRRPVFGLSLSGKRFDNTAGFAFNPDLMRSDTDHLQDQRDRCRQDHSLRPMVRLRSTGRRSRQFTRFITSVEKRHCHHRNTQSPPAGSSISMRVSVFRNITYS